MRFTTILFLFGVLVATSHAYTKRAAPMKRGIPFLENIKLGNLFRVEADARAKIFDNEVGIDGAVGVGGDGIGAHASADADLLGQKAKIHADVLDGHAIDQQNHETFKDSANRQYVLQREYIGSKSVLVRKYLDNGQIYVVGENDDKGLDHGQADKGRIYDRDGGWLDSSTGRYYNRFGQLVRSNSNLEESRIYDRDGGWLDRSTGRYYNRFGQLVRSNSDAEESRIYDRDGGWLDRSTGKYYNRFGQLVRSNSNIEESRIYDRDGDRYPTGYRQRDDYDESINTAHREQINGGWQKDGSYIAVDPPRTEDLKVEYYRDSNGRIVQKTISDDHYEQQEQYRQQELQK